LIPLTEFVTELRRRLDVQLEGQATKLITGRASDYETYLVEWAKRQGLTSARQELDELVKKVYGE